MTYANRCNRCDAELAPGREVWLELDNSTGTWSDTPGEIPPEDSQGGFPFGPDCARRVLREERYTTTRRTDR